MNPFTKRSTGIKRATVLASALFAAANFANAAATSDDQSLRRGAVEDVTPQQKYRTAIREAGGAYKASLRECNYLSGGEQRACRREAKATYDLDMAEAKQIGR